MKTLPLILTAAAIALQGTSVAQEAPVAKSGRYVRVVASVPSEQVKPLDTVVSVTFPRREVRTVGDAARHLVRRTGYGIAVDSEAPSPAHERVTGFPLPEVHRSFESVTVMGVLEALGGEAYRPVIDHASRTVTFAYRAAPLAEAEPEEERKRRRRAVHTTLAAND